MKDAAWAELAGVVAASAYVVGLIELARWIGGWRGVACAVVVPPLAIVLLAILAGMRSVEVRRRQ